MRHRAAEIIKSHFNCKNSASSEFIANPSMVPRLEIELYVATSFCQFFPIHVPTVYITAIDATPLVNTDKSV
jgi:hypothetical protein